jgi:hypothetical protein
MEDRLARRKAQVLFQPVGDGAVLLDTSTEIYYSLNNVGARICALLSEHETLESLCATLASEYPDVPLATLRSDAQELLDALVLQGLLSVPESGAPAPATGVQAAGGDGIGA